MESIDKRLGGVRSNVVASDSYYKKELDKLNEPFGDRTYSVCISDYEGNKTKWLSLNVQYIDELVYYLQVLREGLVKGE